MRRILSLLGAIFVVGACGSAEQEGDIDWAGIEAEVSAVGGSETTSDSQAMTSRSRFAPAEGTYATVAEQVLYDTCSIDPDAEVFETDDIVKDLDTHNHTYAEAPVPPPDVPPDAFPDTPCRYRGHLFYCRLDQTVDLPDATLSGSVVSYGVWETETRQLRITSASQECEGQNCDQPPLSLIFHQLPCQTYTISTREMVE